MLAALLLNNTAFARDPGDKPPRRHRQNAAMPGPVALEDGQKWNAIKRKLSRAELKALAILIALDDF